MTQILLFLAGLVGLWFGAEMITRSALVVAKKLGWSQSFIGMTILAFGTDFPEIMVALTGAVEKTVYGKDTSAIILGNVIGSNMSQIALILGIIGLVKVQKFKRAHLISHCLLLIVSTVLFLMVSLDGFISRTDSIIMLIFFGFYFWIMRREQSAEKKKKKKTAKLKVITFVWMIVGLVVLAESSHMVITHGMELALTFGLSELAVGALLVGLGTSLPELVVSLNAVFRGASELSVGNLIGSNIVDILLALGLSGLIGGWNVDRMTAHFDLPFLVLTAVVVVLFLLTRQRLERKESILMIGLYSVYAILKVLGF